MNIKEKKKLIDGTSNFKIIKETKKNNSFYKIAIGFLFFIITVMIGSLYFILPQFSIQQQQDNEIQKIQTPVKTNVNVNDFADLQKMNKDKMKTKEELIEEVNKKNNSQVLPTVPTTTMPPVTLEDKPTSNLSKEESFNNFFGKNKKKNTQNEQETEKQKSIEDGEKPTNSYSNGVKQQTQSDSNGEQETYVF